MQRVLVTRDERPGPPNPDDSRRSLGAAPGDRKNQFMGKPAVSAFRALASDRRVAMLRALQERDGPMGIDELAAVVDVHVNTAREHLDRLVRSGLVTSAPEVRTTRGRPRMLYSSVGCVSGPADTWSRDRLMLVLVAGYGHPMASPADAAEAAGCTWGRELVARDGADQDAGCVDGLDGTRQVAALATSLEALGFAPCLDLAHLEVSMRRCPFRDLSRERPEVVCALHLGIVRGVLAEHGGPFAVLRIERHPAPTPGVVHLTTL